MLDYPDIRLLTLHRMLEAQTLAAFIASGVDCLVSGGQDLLELRCLYFSASGALAT